MLGEILELIRLSRVFAARVAAGETPAPDDYFNANPTLADLEGFVTRSAAALTSTAAALRAAARATA